MPVANSEPWPGEQTGDPRWVERTKQAPVDDPYTAGPGTLRSLKRAEELDGVTLECPKCHRHKAVMRRQHRQAPLIGTDYWLLCLSFLCRHSSGFSRIEDALAVLVPVLGSAQATALLQS